MTYTVLTFTTNNELHHDDFISKENAIGQFNDYISCKDCKACMILNNKTRATLFLWKEGKFVIINSTRV